jgi:hypothetical protein
VLGVQEQVIGPIAGDEVRKQKRVGVKKADYTEKKAWGECANDFRTFLLSQPELPCLELVSD